MDTLRSPTVIENGTADDCRSPITLRLIDYWRARMPADHGLPRWSDFELMDLYMIAANIAVKDVISDGADYVNRFWGSALTAALGFEGTGVYVSNYQPVSMRAAVQKRYAHIVRTAGTSMARGHISTMPDKAYLPFELVHLPLWGKNDKVEHIISAYDFDPR